MAKVGDWLWFGKGICVCMGLFHPLCHNGIHSVPSTETYGFECLGIPTVHITGIIYTVVCPCVPEIFITECNALIVLTWSASVQTSVSVVNLFVCLSFPASRIH